MNKSIILSGPQFVHLYNGELDHHSEAYYFLFLVCTRLPDQLHHLNLKKKKKEEVGNKKKNISGFSSIKPSNHVGIISLFPFDRTSAL